MTRPFAPTAFGMSDETFKTIMEARLRHCGEYVRHLPVGGDPQWVVMNYQYIPAESEMSDRFKVGGASPLLWGLIDHFEAAPVVYRDGNSVKAASGSQFEVRGVIHNVKSVEINHRGYLRVELSPDSKCADPRADFYDDVEGLLCSSERACVSTC